MPKDASAGIPTDLETLKSIAARQLDHALSSDLNLTDTLNAAARSIAASLVLQTAYLEQISNSLESFDRRGLGN